MRASLPDMSCFVKLPLKLGYGWVSGTISDNAKLNGPRTLADKRWVGPVKCLCITMFDISKMKVKSVLGTVKTQEFLRCLPPYIHNGNPYTWKDSLYIETSTVPWPTYEWHGRGTRRVPTNPHGRERGNALRGLVKTKATKWVRLKLKHRIATMGSFKT